MMLLASGLAAVAGLVAVLTVKDGPLATFRRGVSTPGRPVRVFTRRGTRLGVLGISPHVGTLRHVDVGGDLRDGSAHIAGRRAAGRLGSLAPSSPSAPGGGRRCGGFFADRRGRARVAAWAMMVSAPAAR